jgi:hypothetical protein
MDGLKVCDSLTVEPSLWQARNREDSKAATEHCDGLDIADGDVTINQDSGRSSDPCLHGTRGCDVPGRSSPDHSWDYGP